MNRIGFLKSGLVAIILGSLPFFLEDNRQYVIDLYKKYLNEEMSTKYVGVIYWADCLDSGKITKSYLKKYFQRVKSINEETRLKRITTVFSPNCVFL